MARLWSLLMLVVFVGVPAPALAGTEDAPEITDAEGDPSHPVYGLYGDILAAWIEAETPESFTTVVKLVDYADPMARGAGAGFAFKYNGIDYYTLTFLDQDAASRFWFGHIDRNSITPLDTNETTGDLQTGQPAYLRAVFPKSFLLADVPNGTAPPPKGPPEQLSEMQAATLEFKIYGLGQSQGIDLASPETIDTAGGTESYALQFPVRPAPVQAAPAANNTTAINQTTGPGPTEPAARSSTPFPAFAAIAALAAASLAAGRGRRRER